ncbi:MAG: adenylosuccinate lyase, partial [Actinobacteria bacterium]|nr:adenylosuccinate lyase [Actinomycetota bacterium]NIS31927.1 adenylosuccinate lyase [Actinomycetota bacterium]NIT95973.1 adenylosuccinate lyase [Actinomycetota bacterium]NIU67020.1 adenylosuccinate lyase [Actinomycetota bacterium]NIV87589.1 adenylosuccinate lyase [Actinomycetota bacterium]
EVERHVVGALGLNAEPAATQVVSRDRHAVFLSALAQLMAVLERMAVEIRHLQRSEVAEAAEPF